VPARRGECRQATAFEAIIGKSVTAEGATRRFGFVPGDGDKARQRLVAVLQAQGVQLNQQVTFLSDGGDNVRDLPLYLYPEAEYLLDWFHVTMRLTTMGQAAKSVRARDNPDLSAALQDTLESLKWYLWHGNVFRALQLIDDLEAELEILDGQAEARKLRKAVHEFGAYIRINHKFIPNYGERYRFGEDDLHGLRGIDRESGHEQAHGEEATNALDAPRGTSGAAGAHPGVGWRATPDVLSLVSRPVARR